MNTSAVIDESATYDASTERRFWEKVERGEPHECWLWSAGRSPKGYGGFGVGSGMQLAHRVAWELTNGPIPEGLFICHHCDNPPCCNPDHLFLGTPSDTTADRVAKGRGKKNGSARWNRSSAVRNLTTGRIALALDDCATNGGTGGKLTNGQVAARLDYTPQHVCYLARHGRIPHEQTPLGRLYREDVIEALRRERNQRGQAITGDEAA